MALGAGVRNNPLSGGLCADADTRRGSHPNTHRYGDVCPNTHCCVVVYLNAHCHDDVHLIATFANTHGNTYTAASSPRRHTYTCPPGLV
jgi:hypothetical protein